MPTGTTVEKVYKALRREGMDEGKAARIAQSQTGEALATGRPPKHPVKTANELPDGPDLSLVPSSQRTTEALAQQTEPKQRYVDRLVRLGYSPADAQAKVEHVLAGKTPEEIAEHVRRDERLPDSYFAPGGITGSTTNARDSFRRSVNASRANRSRGRRFANEPEPGVSAPDPLAVPPLPGKPGVANPLWPNLEHFTRGNQSTIEAMERRHPDLLQTTEEQKIAREQQRYNASPMRGRGKGLSNDGADEAENLTTPSSQRVTPSPGNQVLKELRQDKVMRQRMQRAAAALPEF